VTNAIERISRIRVDVKATSLIRSRRPAAELLDAQRALDQQDVRARAAVDQGIDGGVAEEGPVPVGLAVDLDRVEEEGQARRRAEDVEAELLSGEDADLVGAHVGRVDEEADRPVLPQAFDVERLGEDAPQRVHVRGVELVGDQQAPDQGVEQLGRAPVRAPAQEQAGEGERAAAARPVGLRGPAQNASRSSRARAGPPRSSPCATSAPLIAPALVPLMPSISRRPSSSNRSRTPQT
jgi:hypothetical protein